MAARRFIAVLTVAAVSVALAGCSSPAAQPVTDPAQRLHVQIVGTRDHDRTAFTQGLEISDGRLLESTGREGASYIKATDFETGRQLAEATLPSDQFGEGLTVTGNTVWQLTWKDGIAYARDAITLREVREVRYDGEGWGLCTQNSGGLVMSNGTSTLTFRNADSFAIDREVPVTLDGSPLDQLNELECATDGSIYANIWQTSNIARIDPSTGKVTALIDASALEASFTDSQKQGIDVLNGIAEIPGTDHFLVTGKLWPTMFEVTFVS